MSFVELKSTARFYETDDGLSLIVHHHPAFHHIVGISISAKGSGSVYLTTEQMRALRKLWRSQEEAPYGLYGATQQ